MQERPARRAERAGAGGGKDGMKIYENGIYRDMTAEEIAELEKLATEMPTPEPTPEERIAALEKDNAELREAMEALLSGVTA